MPIYAKPVSQKKSGFGISDPKLTKSTYFRPGLNLAVTQSYINKLVQLGLSLWKTDYIISLLNCNYGVIKDCNQ